MTFSPVKYAKGDDIRYATTAKQAVQLEFDGFAVAPETRADLQTRAKEAGIPANQSSEALEQALAEAAVGNGGEDEPSALDQVTPHVEGDVR